MVEKENTQIINLLKLLSKNCFPVDTEEPVNAGAITLPGWTLSFPKDKYTHSLVIILFFLLQYPKN